MAISALLPWVAAQWFTDAGDEVLSGGKVYFYAVGTTTPKTVYQDYQRLAAHPQPVVLSASGHATIFLGDGGYKVVLTDASGAVMDTKDGIFASGGSFVGVGSNATVSFFKTYNDLRAITDGPDVAYVCGRDAEGDGGQGLFQLIPGSSTPDDGGVYLVAGAGSYVYKRIFDESINPEWYGVKYGVATDQSARFAAALSASNYLSFPVLMTGEVYISANIVAQIGTSVRATEDGHFRSGSSVSVTFQTGSRFDGRGPCFGVGVQPVFAAGTVDEIRLSWMNGADSATWTKILASTVATIPLLMDKATTITSDLTIPANLPLRPIGGAVLTVGAFANLSIGSLDFLSPVQFIAYSSAAYVGTVSIGATACYLEWFGGKATNSGADNAIPFKAACMAKRIDLQAGGKNYTVTSASEFSVSDFITWNGNGSKITLNQSITVLGIFLNEITVFGSGSITHSSCVATKTTSIVPLLVGPTSAIDSNLISAAWVTKAQNSHLTNPGSIEGQIAACSINANASIQIKAALWADGCTIQSTSVAPVFVFADDVAESAFVGCIMEAASTFMYSANASLVVTIQGCQNPEWNNGQAIHNGIATVNVIASGVRGNSTATTVDGINGKLFHEVSDVANEDPGMDVSLSYRIYTDGATARWHGVGSPSFSSNFLVIGNSVALDSSPWGLNTIRLASTENDGSAMDALMDKVWRYAGQILVEIEYPIASPPDPESRLCVAMVCPKMGIYTNQDPLTDHHIFGETTAINLPIKNGAKAKNIACIWGGQVTLRVPDDTGYICNDEWRDVSTGTPVLGPGVINGIPRIVIYDKGNKITPAGTKIKIILGAYMPTSDQYAKYWPDTPFEFISGTASQSVRPEPTYIREESPFYIRAVGGVFKTPYSFRSGDANGVQIAKTRIDHKPSTGYPTPIDLPVTVWTNGTTLNGSYT